MTGSSILSDGECSCQRWKEELLYRSRSAVNFISLLLRWWLVVETSWWWWGAPAAFHPWVEWEGSLALSHSSWWRAEPQSGMKNGLNPTWLLTSPSFFFLSIFLWWNPAKHSGKWVANLSSPSAVGTTLGNRLDVSYFDLASDQFG